MLRKLPAALFVAVLALGSAAGLRERGRLVAKLPTGELAARGVRIEGRPIGEGLSPRHFATVLADQALDRPITLFDGERAVLTATPRELGATVDVDWTTARALGVARSGDFTARVEAALAAEAGAFDVALPMSLPVDRLAERLSDLKEATDTHPRGARRYVTESGAPAPGPTGYAATKDEIAPHVDGLALDLYATADAVLGAMRTGSDRAALARFRSTPRATSEAASRADVATVVSSFETRYGGPIGRDKNIARAAALLDGLVLMPDDTVSYNEAVGPRSTDNGFFPAAEIYKGEMREGIGGGACQVASTLHAAAFFGGFDVLERRNHSRPSGYIRVGLDATVSFPVLDLRIKNPFDFPVVLRARATNGLMRFELLGRERRVDVALATETAGILDFNRKLEKAGLPAGEFKLKQKGKRGLKLRKTRTIAPLAGGPERVETSVDTYPAAQEIWLIGPGVDEGALPPIGGAEGV